MLQREWDTFIHQISPYAFFQSWNWGEVEKKTGHTMWRKEWLSGKNVVAIAQIEKIPARRGMFLHIRHGPVLMRKWDAVRDDVVTLAKKEHAWFVRISPQIPDTQDNKNLLRRLGFVPAPIHAMDAEICWVLDLDPSEEELLASMRKTTRYEIRRGQKLNVTVTRSTKSSDLDKFFKLYDSTSTRHNFVQHRGIREEFAVFAQNGDAVLYFASSDGRIIASAIILYFGDEAIYHHGASIQSKIPASHMIQWEAIRDAKKRGMKLYNFWGIAPDDNPKHPWRGLTVFKTGFGGREVRYIHAHDFPLSPLYVVPKTIEAIRKRLKGY